MRREGHLVAKTTSDQGFLQSAARQRDLTALSRTLAVLPRIDHMDGPTIYMEYVEGREGLNAGNARRAGQALRLLHERRDYPHPCMTGLTWLVELADDSLALMDYGQSISPEIAAEYPTDALIHSEPVQFIEKKDDAIVFVDFEGIGMGTRYQDLGFIYYSTIMAEESGLFDAFLEGYHAAPGQIDFMRVKQLAGLIALAYAWFADAEQRTTLGLRLLSETGVVR